MGEEEDQGGKGDGGKSTRDSRGAEEQSLTERSSVLGQIVPRKPIAACSAADPSLWRLSSMSDRQLIGYGRSNCLDQIITSTDRASFI